MAAPGRKKGPAPKQQKQSRPSAPPRLDKPPTRASSTSAPAPAAQPRNGLGLTGLLLGGTAVIASPTIALGVILGIPAMVMGFLSLKRVRAGQASNVRSSVAAIVLGAVALAIVTALVVYGRHLLGTPAGKRYTACLDAAQDKAAREVCEDTFDRER